MKHLNISNDIVPIGVYARDFLDSVNRELSDAQSGNVYTKKELKEELEKRRKRGTK